MRLTLLSTILTTLFYLNTKAQQCLVNTLGDTNTLTGVGLTNGSQSEGDLRYCFNSSLTASGTYAITFASTLSGSIVLQNALPTIKTAVSVSGFGANIILDGNGKYTIVTNTTTGTLSLSYLTLKNGYALNDGAAIYNKGVLNLAFSTVSGNTCGRYGGGIYNEANNVNIESCTISNNSASAAGGGVEHFSTGTLKIKNSSFYGNVGGKYSGAIDAYTITGKIFIENSTLYANSAGQYNTSDLQSAGAMYNGCSTTIIGATIVNNSALGSNMGGGIYNAGSLLLVNSIVSGNSAASGSDVLKESASSLSAYYNIFSSAVSGVSDGVNGNIVNTTIGGSLFAYGLVYYNGGLTPVLPLALGSPAIAAGISSFSGYVFSVTDQNGLARTGVYDLGANEFQPLKQAISGFPIISNRNYGNPVITISGVKGGGSNLPVSFGIITSPASGVAYIIANTVSVSGATTTTGCLISIAGIGNVTITGAQAGNLYYQPISDQRTFTIDKGFQYFTSISSVPGLVYGKTLSATLSASVSSGLSVSFSLATEPATGVATLVNGKVVSVLGVGTVTVTASQVGNSYYYPATDFVQSFTISKGTQTVTGISTIPNVTFGGVNKITVFANTSSSLAATFSIVTEPVNGVASISANVISILGAGTVTVTGSQAGNDYYYAAVERSTSFVIAKAQQTISITPIADFTFGQKDTVTVTASASSGLPLIYELLSEPDTGVVALYENKVAILGPGKASVLVSQAGNENYLATGKIATSFYIWSVTAVESPSEGKSLKVYPNPNTGEFTIETNRMSAESPLSVVDVFGNTVAVWTTNTTSNVFKISNLASGVYFCRQDKLIFKVIVQ